MRGSSPLPVPQAVLAASSKLLTMGLGVLAVPYVRKLPSQPGDAAAPGGSTAPAFDDDASGVQQAPACGRGKAQEAADPVGSQELAQEEREGAAEGGPRPQGSSRQLQLVLLACHWDDAGRPVLPAWALRALQRGGFDRDELWWLEDGLPGGRARGALQQAGLGRGEGLERLATAAAQGRRRVVWSLPPSAGEELRLGGPDPKRPSSAGEFGSHQRLRTGVSTGGIATCGAVLSEGQRARYAET